jgi:hypothetical protein
MELTHLGTLKMLLSEVLLLAGEQRQARQDLQMVIDRLRQDSPEDAVNPPPSRLHTRNSQDESMGCIRELQATVSTLVNEVVGVRSALQGNADNNTVCRVLPGACDFATIPELRAELNRAEQPNLPKLQPSVAFDNRSDVQGRALQFSQLVSNVSEQKALPAMPNPNSPDLIDLMTGDRGDSSTSVQLIGQACLLDQEQLSISENQGPANLNSVTTMKSRLTQITSGTADLRVFPQTSSHSSAWRKPRRKLRGQPSAGVVKEALGQEPAAGSELPVKFCSSEGPCMKSETASCLISESASRFLHRQPGRIQAASILDHKRLDAELVVAARPGTTSKTQEMGHTHTRRVDAACDSRGNQVVFVARNGPIEPPELPASSSLTVSSSRHRAVRQHHLAVVQPSNRVLEQPSSVVQALDQDVIGAISFEELREGLARLTFPHIRIYSDD